MNHRTLITTLVLTGATLGALVVARQAMAVPSTTPQAGAEPVQADAKTGIAWEVQPAEVVIYLDEKRIGTAGDTKFSDAKPGKHTVKLMRGKDETEMEVVVKKGQSLKFVYQFED